MHLKKVIMAGAAVALFSGSVLSVSAAELTAGNYGKTLKESGKENLIIDVEAYKAAYSDLAEAFGDDEEAYIEHYLTIGVYEGRTKGVLFDPLAYAEAYGDVKAAFGNDISAIVNHYVTFGVAENRTMGTASGYEDIAAAEKAGSPQVVVQRKGNSTNGYSAQAAVNDYGINADIAGNGSIVTDGSNYENNTAGGGGSNIAVGNTVNSNVAAASVNSSAAAGSGIANAPTAGSTANYVNNTAGSGDSNIAVDNTANSNVAESVNSSAAASSGTSNAPADGNTANASANNEKNYHHTTSIYTNDESTLLRVEYYDENNKLFEYSQVTDYDKETNSYTEKVYQYDNENNVQVPVRTDTYVNGELASSEKH